MFLDVMDYSYQNNLPIKLRPLEPVNLSYVIHKH